MKINFTVKTILIMIVLCLPNYAQQVRVGETLRLTSLSDGKFMNPKASPSGTIFFTGEGNRGVYYLSEADNSIIKLNDELGAGYEFVFSNDGKSLFYRSDNYVAGKKYSELKEQIISTKEITLLQPETRFLDVPRVSSAGSIIFGIDDKLQVIGSDRVSKKDLTELNEPIAKSVKNEIWVYTNGIKKTLQPLGDTYYIWTSLSPDKSKILFYAVGKGTFVSDLNGNILVELGDIRYPQWSPDGKWISYMLDIDDGRVVIESDIYIISTDGQSKHKITNTENIIEVYPSWNKNSLIYSDSEGMIYSTQLFFE